MLALAAGLLGLIALLATLQYKWLGQISQAERDRMSATLGTNAAGFAEDFDRELNRAYLLFQLPPLPAGESIASQLAARYDWWRANARFPRLIKEIYVAAPDTPDVTLKRFDPATRFVEPAEWPAALAGVRAQLARPQRPEGGGTFLVHVTVPTMWPDVPALVVTSPLMFFNRLSGASSNVPWPPPQPSYSVLLLDGDYIRGELLPWLAQHHFQGIGGGSEYELAVVPTSGKDAVYHSVPGFSPSPDARVDATADLFHLRVQDFGPLAAEISRFTLFAAVTPKSTTFTTSERGSTRRETVVRHTIAGAAPGLGLPNGAPLSIIVQQNGRSGVAATVTDQLMTDRLMAGGGAGTTATMRPAAAPAPHWRLLVKHPSGSLEHAVNSVRRRNLAISTGILGILGLSVGFLVVSTRRAQDLARQQLEFVATVSHELRTPLAVIRSAADNLADGVVGDEARVRQYGELVRREGVRLTELVEQILEFAGLQSGQRAVARHPVTVDAVLREAAAGAQSAAEAAGVHIELAIAERLPAVGGDEAALRRVFLNLIGNAVKYGADAGWVGVRASANGSVLEVAVTDRGIGIAPAEQAKIFEPFYRTPDVVAAQIQGAGLGLSLVKRIVEAHGGRIAVTSAPGQGSTFTVMLPALSEIAPADTTVDDASPQHS
jgi:signal transduction histidine kinase